MSPPKKKKLNSRLEYNTLSYLVCGNLVTLSKKQYTHTTHDANKLEHLSCTKKNKIRTTIASGP